MALQEGDHETGQIIQGLHLIMMIDSAPIQAILQATNKPHSPSPESISEGILISHHHHHI